MPAAVSRCRLFLGNRHIAAGIAFRRVTLPTIEGRGIAAGAFGLTKQLG